jgi:hypothetical protein
MYVHTHSRILRQQPKRNSSSIRTVCKGRKGETGKGKGKGKGKGRDVDVGMNLHLSIVVYTLP